MVLWHGLVVVAPWLWDRRKANPKPSFPWPNFLANAPSFVLSCTVLLLYVLSTGRFRQKLLHCAKSLLTDVTNVSVGNIPQA